MTSLEPPSLPYTAVATGLGTQSNRTSITRISMEGDGNDTEGIGAREDAASHELATQPGPTTKDTLPPIPSPASESKIGSEGEETSPESMLLQAPQAYITFLIISGRRRTMSFEPETTVGRVKELVWNAWPTEWESERPLGPSYMRILYLGKMLQDDDTLAQLKFPTHMTQSDPAPIPTIVHLSVRPFAPSGENDLKKKRGRARGGDAQSQGDAEDSATPSCCCIIC